jgi:hypothetical protein
LFKPRLDGRHPGPTNTLAQKLPSRVYMQIIRVTQRGFDTIDDSRPPGSSTTAGSGGTWWAELEHQIGYSHLMNRFEPTKALAVPRSVALRDEVYAPQGVPGESIRVVGD